MIRNLINTLTIFMAVVGRDTIAVCSQNQSQDIKFFNVILNYTVCNGHCVLEDHVLRDIRELM